MLKFKIAQLVQMFLFPMYLNTFSKFKLDTYSMTII